jgi:hypothetical protein
MSPSKYQPLADWLAAQPGDSVTLTFAQIQAILGQQLPVTARQISSWWTGGPRWHYRPPPWRVEGWEVDTRRREPGVTFKRTARTAPSCGPHKLILGI